MVENNERNPARRFSVFIIITLILLGINGAAWAAAAYKDGIKISGESLFLNDKLFFINAVGYAGWRPHQWPGTDKVDLRLVDIDFRRIKEAGFNAIRSWDALSPEELSLAKKYDLKVIQGIWLNPSADFSNKNFLETSIDYVQDVARWSSPYDNVLMYLVMTEPRQEAVLYSGVKNVMRYFQAIKKAIQRIDYKPVSMDSWISVAFLDHSIWDVVTFNAFMFTPESVNKLIGFENYLYWVKKSLASGRPFLIGETGGFSVSPFKKNDIGFGGNTQGEQSRGNLQSIQSAIDTGAAGAVTVSWIDTWHYPSDPAVHNDDPWEWDGILGFKDSDLREGQPRQFYYDARNFNQKLAKDLEKNHNSSRRLPLDISFGRMKSVYYFGEKIKVHFTVRVNGEALADHALEAAFFYPREWREDYVRVRTDKGGGVVLKYDFPVVAQSQYVFLVIGFDYEGQRYGDMRFFRVDGEKETSRNERGSFFIYYDKEYPGNHFMPSGWTGDYKDLSLNDGYAGDPQSGKTCIKIQYFGKKSLNKNWAGIYWQNELNNWLDDRHTFDLSQFSQLTFWMRGALGGERVEEIGVGGLHPNSDDIKIGPVVLTKEWQKYAIDLRGKDLSRIIHGFRIYLLHDDNPHGCTIYLDDIKFEKNH